LRIREGLKIVKIFIASRSFGKVVDEGIKILKDVMK
jgi:hypothetical protein